MASLGIIGTGSFGRFMAEKLEPYFDVKLAGRKSSSAEYAEAASSDYVVLSIPYQAYAETLPALSKHFTEKTVVVDVCSVKTLPEKLLAERCPQQSKLMLHPLFGPQSAADSLEGHTMILCPQPDNEDLEARARQFFEKLGLKVQEMTAEEHDKLMAEVHGLTFFVARALEQYGIKPRAISTPSYERLVDLAELEMHHSPELFATIQLANPYASEVREHFMRIIEKLDRSLEQEES